MPVCIICQVEGATHLLGPCTCTEGRYHIHCLTETILKGSIRCGVCRGSNGPLEVRFKRSGDGNEKGMNAALARTLLIDYLSGPCHLSEDDIEQRRIQPRVFGRAYIALTQLVCNPESSILRTRNDWVKFLPAMKRFLECILRVLFQLRPEREVCTHEFQFCRNELSGINLSTLISYLDTLFSSWHSLHCFGYIDEVLIDGVEKRVTELCTMDADVVRTLMPLVRGTYDLMYQSAMESVLIDI